MDQSIGSLRKLAIIIANLIITIFFYSCILEKSEFIDEPSSERILFTWSILPRASPEPIERLQTPRIERAK